MRKLFVVLLMLAASIAFLPAPQALAAGTRGMVLNDNSNKAVVFDTTTNAVIGSVALSPSSFGGDCSITPDGKLAAAVNFSSNLFFVDISATPPVLASGTNPVSISNFGEDSSMTKDGKFVVTSDGSASQPLSSVSVATRNEVSTLSLSGSGHNSVEVLSNGSVLATSSNTTTAYRGLINGTGLLSGTADLFALGADPNNVVGAPNGLTGAVVTRSAATVRSFLVSGLVPVTTRSLSGSFGISAVINSGGDRLYVRSNSVLDAFSFNSTSGAIGAAPLWSTPIVSASTYFGMDQMAITGDGKRLFVSQPSALKVYNAATGALLTSITHPDISGATGVCLPTGPGVAPCPALTLLPYTLPAGTQGSQYFHSPFVLQSGKAPATFRLTGALPTGMAFGGNSLFGVPDQPGNYPISVRGTDANGCSASRSYVLVIHQGFSPGTKSNLQSRPAVSKTTPAKAKRAPGRTGPYRSGLHVS